MSETQAFERTASARRRRGRAYGRAELHHRLVERPRPLGGDEASGELADPSLGCGPRHVVRDPEESGDDALVVWRSGDDPSALEEVLGDENAVRVGRATPRKVPTVRIVPRERARADLDRGQLSHHRVRCAAGYIRDSGHRGKAAEPFTLTLNKVDSLENLTRLPAPENQVKHRHGDLDIARESLHPRLDLQIAPRGQRVRHASNHRVVNQVPKDVTIEDRKVLAAAGVSQKMARLLQTEAVHLANEPLASAFR